MAIEVELDSPQQALLRIFYGRDDTGTFVRPHGAGRRLHPGHNHFRTVITDDRMNGNYRIDLSTGGTDVHLKRLEFKKIEAAAY